jgi:hypothetical protein
VFQQGQGLRGSPRQGVRIAEFGGHCGKEERQIHGPTQQQAVFERGDSLLGLPLAEAEVTDTPRSQDETKWVVQRLGQSEGLLGDPDRFAKLTKFGKTYD